MKEIRDTLMAMKGEGTMKGTIAFLVNIEQQTVDGCGNEVKPLTEGEVRRAIEQYLENRNIQSVYVSGV